MGYLLRLVGNLKSRDVLPVPYTIRGSVTQINDNFALYGSCMAQVTITANYTKVYDFRRLHGLSGQQTQEPLTRLLNNLVEEPLDEDYYKPTDGNIRVLALGLLGWAQHQPTGIWETLG